MAINFEAANMAGYNNPKVYMFNVSVNDNVTKVLDAPSFATISNILKSGFLPVLYVTLATGDAVIAPLAAINKEGDYLFCRVFSVSVSPTPVMISFTYVKNTETPIVMLVNL